MTTIDLSRPTPRPTSLLDALPRRVTVTLLELQLVAERAGGAPLPFDVAGPREAPPLEGRLGASPAGSGDTAENQAYVAALASLHDPAVSLARRGLLVDDELDEGIAGAVGLLATPQVAVDLDVAVDGAPGVQVKAWHRQAGDAVASLATCDGIVFELAWFPTSAWPDELARVAVLPEDLTLRTSRVPSYVDLPYELADGAVEADLTGRPDLLQVLTAQHSGTVRDEAGQALADAEVTTLLHALAGEAQGRLRALVADVSEAAPSVVGVRSWVLLADGWRSLGTLHHDGATRIELRSVAPAALAADLAPVLAEVTT